MNITTEIFHNAMRYAGVAEIPGVNNNQTILNWIRQHLAWINNEEDAAWCAIYVAEMFKEFGYSELIPESPYAAIRWRKVRRGIEITSIDDLQVGDLVVTARYSFSDWRSHIGWFAGISSMDKKRMVLFGGNQNNTIGLRSYKTEKFRFGIRII